MVNFRTKCLAGTLLLALTMQCGCSRSVSLSQWQNQLDHYASDEVNDDTSFLRQNPLRSPQRNFTIIGTGTPEKSTDVTGVLIARKPLQGSDWLIFLVGQVKHRQVEDSRIALRSDDGGTPRWLIGQQQKQAFERYRAHQEAVWRENHPGREKPPMFAHQFPAESDAFRLEQAGDEVTVTHEQSGAQWSMQFSAQQARQ
jgi:hypothetical protein